jgi:signal peptidase I
MPEIILDLHPPTTAYHGTNNDYLQAHMKPSKPDTFMDTFKTVFYAIVIAMVVRTFAYEPFNIPSGSMKPTLLIGDYLFVSKFSYGYSKYSLPFSLPLIEDRIFFTEPERGDVVVFKLPKDNKTDYIKRIVGLPGDRLQVVKGILHVNGTAVGRENVDDFMEEDYAGSFRRTPQYAETLPNGVVHNILEESDTGFLDNTQIYVVPEGHYFGMGDNRDHSNDSRVLNAVGYIPAKNLVGRAEFMFFSLDGKAWEIWKWPSTVRFSRIFSGIE